MHIAITQRDNGCLRQLGSDHLGTIHKTAKCVDVPTWGGVEPTDRYLVFTSICTNHIHRQPQDTGTLDNIKVNHLVVKFSQDERIDTVVIDRAAATENNMGN